MHRLTAAAIDIAPLPLLCVAFGTRYHSARGLAEDYGGVVLAAVEALEALKRSLS